MMIVATSGLTAATLLKSVAGALVAGLGVTIAFSVLIYCSDRAIELRRADRDGQALALSAAAMVALLVCLGIVVGGLVLVASKPK